MTPGAQSAGWPAPSRQAAPPMSFFIKRHSRTRLDIQAAAVEAQRPCRRESSAAGPHRPGGTTECRPIRGAEALARLHRMDGGKLFAASSSSPTPLPVACAMPLGKLPRRRRSQFGRSQVAGRRVDEVAAPASGTRRHGSRNRDPHSGRLRWWRVDSDLLGRYRSKR